MSDDKIIVALCFFSVFIGVVSYLFGYCFGKADGIRWSNKEWKGYLDKYVDPYIKSLNESVKFFKDNSIVR